MHSPTKKPLPDHQWLEAFPAKERRILRKFGISPDRDPRAADFNRRLVALAERGLRGMDFAIAADKLHDEVFGDTLTCEANAQHLSELIKLNAVGHVEDLAIVVRDHDDELTTGIVGSFSDAPYVMRSIDAVADVLDAAGPDTILAGLVDELPPPRQPTADQLADNRARIDAILRELAEANARGRVAGTAAIAFSRWPAIYHFAGHVPPRAFADMLRELRDRIARGER